MRTEPEGHGTWARSCRTGCRGAGRPRGSALGGAANNEGARRSVQPGGLVMATGLEGRGRESGCGSVAEVGGSGGGRACGKKGEEGWSRGHVLRSDRRALPCAWRFSLLSERAFGHRASREAGAPEGLSHCAFCRAAARRRPERGRAVRESVWSRARREQGRGRGAWEAEKAGPARAVTSRGVQAPHPAPSPRAGALLPHTRSSCVWPGEPLPGRSRLNPHGAHRASSPGCVQAAGPSHSPHFSFRRKLSSGEQKRNFF